MQNTRPHGGPTVSDILKTLTRRYEAAKEAVYGSGNAQSEKPPTTKSSKPKPL